MQLVMPEGGRADAPSLSPQRPSGPQPSQSPAPSPGRKSNVVDERTAARMRALNGKAIGESTTLWKAPTSKLEVFVSSPFDDTVRERDVLMEKILPDLRKQGRADGIEVMLVDMRWGVRDENTIDHQTWPGCKRELERCHRESEGLFFLSLQSDRYGTSFLPRELTKDKMESALAKASSDEERDLAKEWYLFDENCGHFVLKKMASTGDPEYWHRALPVLKDGMLQGMVLNDGAESGMAVGQSVTEWETRFALNLAGAPLRSYWFHRHFGGYLGGHIGGGVTEELNKKHRLADNVAGGVKLQTFKALMRDKLGQSRISEDVAVTADSFDAKDAAWDKYMSSFESRARAMFDDEMHRIVETKSQWSLHGCGLDMRGDDLSEILHHVDWAREKIKDFEGRDEELKRALELVSRGSGSSGLCIAVVGRTGAGKTAFMSKLAQQIVADGADKPVIVRFCGTSRGSTSGFGLVQSLCRQIERLFVKSSYVTSYRSYEAWVKRLHALLAAHPVVLIIDSLDQLGNNNDERAGLSFLRDLKPHPDTRVIVSCLPDEVDEQTKKRYFYGCESRLNEWSVQRIDIKALANDSAVGMVKQLLKRKERSLTAGQWDALKPSLSNTTALYCRLAARVASSWSSSFPPEMCTLPVSVPALFNSILDGVEQEFGSKWSRVALACITFSRSGLSDAELQDVLSLSDEHVLSDVLIYFKPDMPRFPLHVWLRLKGALQGLVVEREHGCVQWFHRQLRETAEARYSEAQIGDTTEKQLAHNLMARYFGDLCGPEGEKRLVARQPLSYVGTDLLFQPEAKVNVRRCVEAPFHLVEAGGDLVDDAIRELCNIRLVCACAKIGLGIELQNILLKLENVAGARDDRISHYTRWLRSDMSVIQNDPHFKSLAASASKQPLCSIARHDMNSITWGQSQFNASSTEKWELAWTSGVQLGGKARFDEQLMSLSAHAGKVNSVQFSPDGHLLVSGSDDCTVKLWDASTGACVKTLPNYQYGKVHAVAFSAVGSLLAAAYESGSIWLWDTESWDGKPLHGVHEGSVLCLSFSPDCRSLASGGTDGQICVCKIIDGQGNYRLDPMTHAGGWIHAVAFSNSFVSKCLVTASTDKSIKIWSAVSWICLKTLSGNSDVVMSLAFCPRGNRFACADRFVRVWSVDTCALECPAMTKHREMVLCVDFSRDGRHIASCSKDGLVAVFDAQTGRPLQELDGKSGPVHAVAFSPDGSHLVSGYADKSLKVWDLREAERRESMKMSKVRGGGRISFVAFGSPQACSSSSSSSSRGLLLATITDEKFVRVFEAQSGRCLATLQAGKDAVRVVACSPDGTRIVAGADASAVKIFNMDLDSADSFDCCCEKSLVGHSSQVHAASFSADSRLVATGAADKMVLVFDVDSGSIFKKLKGHTDCVYSVAFSPDGTTVASGSADTTVRVWSLADDATGQCLHTLTDQHRPTAWVRLVHFSPDGLTLLSASTDKVARLWSTATWKCQPWLLEHDAEVTSAAISADGHRVVCVDGKTARVWDATSGLCVATLQGQTDKILSVVFSADNQHLALASKERCVQMKWDLPAERA